MGKANIRKNLLAEWARYLQGAAQAGAFTRKGITLRITGVMGPRAGALELYAGMDAPAMLKALGRNNSALLRQFIPWQFSGEPLAYMAGRYVRVEAGWPADLADTMIRLTDINKRPERGGRWVAGKSELKSVLSRLESRQQALIFGHAVPMPVVIRTREYGSAESYQAFTTSGEVTKEAAPDIEELWD